MAKRERETISGMTQTINSKLMGSAYSYYGGAVQMTGGSRTARGVRRLFAAALLSGASVVAVGIAGSGAARAGTCSTIGTTVICTGSFDESVQYTGVEDLTVTLGAGSVIDTSGEASEADFDNAGIFVTGENDVTAVNNGSILTGDEGYYAEEYGPYFGGYRHHGIAAYSDEGEAAVRNSAQGTIVTTSEHSHGAIAVSGFEDPWGGDASAVNHGLIGTEGNDSYGLAAVAKYTATAENSGAIATDGEGSYGIFVSSYYDAYAVNSGSIETYGEDAHGIRIEVEADHEYSSIVDVDNSGSIETYGENSQGISISAGESAVTVANSGSIFTEGDEADGISAWGNTVGIGNSGEIVTYGEFSDGVSIEGDTVYLNNSGSIRVYGYGSNAVEADSEGDDTTTIVNTGTIAAYNEDSNAIEASGPTVRITNDVLIEDDEIVASGLIYAEEGRAIEVDEADYVYVYNNASVVGAVEVNADEYALLDNSGSIVSNEEDETLVTISADDEAAVFVNREGGTVSTSGDDAGPVYVHSEGGFADLRNYGSISTGHVEEGFHTYGHNSFAAYAFAGEGALAVNTGLISTLGDDAAALRATTGDELAQVLNTGTITTSGDNSHGVLARVLGEEVYIGYDYYHEPISVTYGGSALAGNTGDAGTSGDAAYGVAAIAEYGDAIAYNMLGGSIVTSGEGSHGLVAASGAEPGNVLEYGHGDGGVAIAVNGFAPGLYEGVSFIGFEDGHVSVADFVEIGELDPEDYRSTIVTTGDEAAGVLAVATGDEESHATAANFYGTVTTGELDDYGDPVSGSESHGVVAMAWGEESYAIAANKYHAHVTTNGERAYGVAAFATEEALAANWLYSTVTTQGSYSHGVMSESEAGDAFAANKYDSSIVTHGDGAIGLFAQAGSFTYYDNQAYEYVTGGGEAIAVNQGSTIVTYGENAHGILATAEYGNAEAANIPASVEGEGDEEEILAARVETHGESAHAMFALSEDGIAYAFNAGDLITYGDYSRGIQADGETVTVFNSGSIYTYGEYSHGISARSEDILTTTVTNSGIIRVTGEDADGIYATGPTVNITNEEDGDVYSYAGDALYVAYAEEVTIVNYGTISAAENDGIDVNEAGGVTVRNYGSIYAGESAIEVGGGDEALVYNYGAIDGRVDISEFGGIYFLNDEDATIVVAEDNSSEDGGIYLAAHEAADMINRGSVAVHADDTYGVHLRGSTVSLGNSGTISASGEYSHAVVAHSDLPATTTIENSGTIEATGGEADAIRASGPSVYITNEEGGIISSDDGDAIYAFDTKYVSIVNHGDIYGDVIAVAEDFYEFGASAYVLNTGLIDGDLDMSGGDSDDTVIVDGGRVTGAISTGDGTDEVTIQGEGVELGLGVHASGEGEAALVFAHDDEIVLDDGIEGWAISGFDTVGFESGRVELDGFGIHTARGEGTVDVAYGATLATTGEGAYVSAAEVNIDGTLDIGLGGFFDVTGDLAFGGDSLFFTRVQDMTAGAVSGNTVTFAEGTTIFADVTGSLAASVGEDILVASATQENGVTDHGAVVEDNIFLFYFEKVMNGSIVETGSADELFLRVQIEETAFDTADDAAYTKNQLSIADALDVYLRTQPLSSPLVQWLAQFDTEEEQREELLKVIRDTLPEEGNGTGTATMASTDLIYDMIMDRLSGGGFTVATSGETGLAAGDAPLGGDGKWAIWGRAGASRAQFTPGGVNGFDADSWGLTVGIDGEVAPNTRAGFGGFYIASDVEENGAGANASNDITGYGVTAYMSYRPGAWYVNGALGYGMNEYDSRRLSLGGTNTANYDGSQFVARAEVGHMFTSGQWDITPNAGLRYNRVDIDAYTETGPLPISVNGQTVDSLRAVAGVNARYSFLLEEGGKLIPEFGVKVLGELAAPDKAITGSVAGGGAFAVQSVPRDDVSYGIGAGVTWEVSDRFSLRVTYDGEFQSDYDEQALAAAFRFAF